MQVELFTLEHEPERRYKLLKIVELQFIPAKDSIYIDKENNIEYEVIMVVFTETKIAVILNMAAGHSQAFRLIANLVS